MAHCGQDIAILLALAQKYSLGRIKMCKKVRIKFIRVETHGSSMEGREMVIVTKRLLSVINGR